MPWADTTSRDHQKSLTEARKLHKLWTRQVDLGTRASRPQVKIFKVSMTKKDAHNTGEILIYTPKGKKTQIDVSLQDDSVWLTLNQISDLFERDKSVISKHLQNIFKGKELTKKATVAKFATVQIEGDSKNRI